MRFLNESLSKGRLFFNDSSERVVPNVSTHTGLRTEVSKTLEGSTQVFQGYVNPSIPLTFTLSSPTSVQVTTEVPTSLTCTGFPGFSETLLLPVTRLRSRRVSLTLHGVYGLVTPTVGRQGDK